MSGEHSNAPDTALSCPQCQGTAMEARGLHAFGKQSLLSGYYWYCFNDGFTPPGVNCEFNGPEKPTSAEALAAWNAIPRKSK